MIRTLTLNPFIVLDLVAVSQTIVVLVLLFVPKGYRPTGERAKQIYQFVRHFFHGLAGLGGILFLDIAIMWLAGSWTQTDWAFQLPGVLLLLIIGMEYLFMGLLRDGFLPDLLYGIATALTFVLFLHWWIPQDPVMSEKLEGYLPVVLGIVFGGYIVVALWKTLWSVSQRGDDENPVKGEKLVVFDLRTPLERIFNRPLNIVLWILATIQSILSFSGYSLFTIFVP